MRLAVWSLSLLLLATPFAAAQSGRVSPTPSPSPSPEESSIYSESEPGRRRATRPTAVPITSQILAPAMNAKPGDDDEVVKVSTDLVTIPVSVFDRNGLYIPGLTKENFKIYEDGREQQIAYFGAQDKPFTVALLLDCSPSTKYKIEEIRGAARSFIRMLAPNDSVMVMYFQQQLHVATKPTRDREQIERAIEKARYDNGTSVYDAVDVTLRKYFSKLDGRKAVVLFTDGVDTTSEKASFDTTLNYAEESDALVFPIYYNTFAENQDDPLAIGTSREDYERGAKWLDELADVTGGRVFRPEGVPGGLDRAFEGIAEELRRQYNIGYVPDTEGKPGQRKAIRVRVDRPNLIIRARDSYVVGTARPAPVSKPTQK